MSLGSSRRCGVYALFLAAGVKTLHDALEEWGASAGHWDNGKELVMGSVLDNSGELLMDSYTADWRATSTALTHTYPDDCKK